MNEIQEFTPAVDAVPDDGLLDSAVTILRLLADRTRLAILSRLAEHQDLPVGAIADAVHRPAPNVSQHLAKLRSGGLVQTRRDGTTIHYRLTNEHVAALVEQVLLHSEHTLYSSPPHHRR